MPRPANAIGASCEDVAHLLGDVTEGTRQGRGRTECHRGEDRTVVGLVEVGTHACHVTDVVTDVVSNRCGVARIIFGNTRFDLADQVGTDIGGLGVDTTTDTGEQGLRGGTHAVGQHDGGDFLKAGIWNQLIPQEEPDADIKQREADYDEAHDGTGAERNGETVVQGLLGSKRGSRRGIRCHLHAEPTTQAGEQTGDGNTCSGPERLDVQQTQNEEDRHQHDEDDEDDLVLTHQVSHGALSNGLGDLDHVVITLRSAHHGSAEDEGEQKGQDSSDGSKEPDPGVVHDWLEISKQ